MIFCICFGANFRIFFCTYPVIWEVPFILLHVASLAFDLEIWRVSGKNRGSGEFERDQKNDFSIEETWKKTRFEHIRAFKHHGDESWKHNRVLLPFQ